MAPGNLQTNYLGFQRNNPLRNINNSRPIITCTLVSRLSDSTGINNNNMDVSRNIDDMQKIDIERQVNGDSENSPNFDQRFKENLPKMGREAGGDNCHKESLISENLRTQIRKLTSLSLRHLDMIDQQQKQLLLHERELSKVRSEKYTLQRRLERMQRRTSLAEKSFRNNHQTQSNNKPSEPPSTPAKRRKSEAFTTSTPTVLKRFQSSVQNSSTTPSSSKQLKLQQDSSKKSHKKVKKIDNDRKEKAKSKKETKQEDKKKDKNGKCLDTRPDKEEKKPQRLEDKYMFTQTLYPTLQDLRVELPYPGLPKNASSVEVPSWRTADVCSGDMSENSEDDNDDVYERRHSKMEHEEKKRKRWDAQRVRELRIIEKMEWKAVQKEMAKWAHILTSFCQEPNDAKVIEVSKSIPVVAFGAIVPKLKSRPFSLSWFDPQERERDETRRQTRSRSSKV